MISWSYQRFLMDRKPFIHRYVEKKILLALKRKRGENYAPELFLLKQKN